MSVQFSKLLLFEFLSDRWSPAPCCSRKRAFLRHRIHLPIAYTVFVAVACIAFSRQSSAELFDLKNLTEAQRKILFEQVQNYATVIAAMNYCERPPFLERRVRAVASNCITPDSLDAVEARFKEEVAKESGRIDCTDKTLQRIFGTATEKMGYLIDDLRKACKLRVFYQFRLF